jgi:hypothetical protein
MPFKPEEETNVTTYIVRKEIETIREVPFFPEKMEKLILTNLIVTKNIEIPDPTIFYRPNPEKLSNSFLNFCTPSNIVEFKINDSAFLTFDEKYRQIHSSKIGCSTLNADIVQSKRAEFDELIIPSLTVSTICADVISWQNRVCTCKRYWWGFVERWYHKCKHYSSREYRFSLWKHWRMLLKK